MRRSSSRPYLFAPNGRLGRSPHDSFGADERGLRPEGVREEPVTGPIQQVTLVRLSSVTHTFNMNQRFQRASFTSATGGVTVTKFGQH